MEAEAADSDKEADGAEVAGGAGEEADFRSFILEHSETILINLRALYSGLNCNYKQGQDYLWRRL